MVVVITLLLVSAVSLAAADPLEVPRSPSKRNQAVGQCSGQAYVLLKQICCEGVIWDDPYGLYTCCGSIPCLTDVGVSVYQVFKGQYTDGLSEYMGDGGVRQRRVHRKGPILQDAPVSLPPGTNAIQFSKSSMRSPYFVYTASKAENIPGSSYFLPPPKRRRQPSQQRAILVRNPNAPVRGNVGLYAPARNIYPAGVPLPPILFGPPTVIEQRKSVQVPVPVPVPVAMPVWQPAVGQNAQAVPISAEPMSGSGSNNINKKPDLTIRIESFDVRNGAAKKADAASNQSQVFSLESADALNNADQSAADRVVVSDQTSTVGGKSVNNNEELMNLLKNIEMVADVNDGNEYGVASSRSVSSGLKHQEEPKRREADTTSGSNNAASEQNAGFMGASDDTSDVALEMSSPYEMFFNPHVAPSFFYSHQMPNIADSNAAGYLVPKSQQQQQYQPVTYILEIPNEDPVDNNEARRYRRRRY